MPPSKTKSNKAKGKTTAASSRSSPHFLTIALELRQIVYKQILRDSPSSLTDLLIANRQLAIEVLPYQFRRHLTFDGQEELFDWLDHVDHRYLRHVVDIKFKLHDIEPETIVGALGKRLRQANLGSRNNSQMVGAKDNPYHEACDAEVRKIGEAFKLIPNVRKLTLATTDAGDPQPPQRMLSTFSKMLAHRFLHLHTLISYEDAMSVHLLSNKPGLRRLRFPAISISNNTEIAGVFSTLSLTDLEIYRLPHQISPMAPRRRILAQVLRSLQPVRSLLLYEEEADSEEPDLTYEAFVHCRDAFSRHKSAMRRFTFAANTARRVDESDDEWMIESRTALRKFLREAAQRMEVVSFAANMWDDHDAP